MMGFNVLRHVTSASQFPCLRLSLNIVATGFRSSMSEPGSSSRHLFAWRHLASQQVTIARSPVLTAWQTKVFELLLPGEKIVRQTVNRFHTWPYSGFRVEENVYHGISEDKEPPQA
jgi:hypothetical protein